MPVTSLGTYTPALAPLPAPATALPQPARPAIGGDVYYAPSTPYYGQPTVTTQSTDPGLTIGRMAAWAGGIFAALKFLRPVFASPSGWLTVAIAGLGWLAGEKLWQFVTGNQ